MLSRLACTTQALTLPPWAASAHECKGGCNAGGECCGAGVQQWDIALEGQSRARSGEQSCGAQAADKRQSSCMVKGLLGTCEMWV